MYHWNSYTILTSILEVERAILQLKSFKFYTNNKINCTLVNALPLNTDIQLDFDKIYNRLIENYGIGFDDYRNIPKQCYAKTGIITYDKAFNHVVRNWCDGEYDNLITDPNSLAISQIRMTGGGGDYNSSSISGLRLILNKFNYMWPRLIIAHRRSNVYELDARSVKIGDTQLPSGGMFYVFFKNNPKCYANGLTNCTISSKDKVSLSMLPKQLHGYLTEGIEIDMIGQFLYYRIYDKLTPKLQNKKDIMWREILNHCIKNHKAPKKKTYTMRQPLEVGIQAAGAGLEVPNINIAELDDLLRGTGRRGREVPNNVFYGTVTQAANPDTIVRNFFDEHQESIENQPFIPNSRY